MAWNGSGTYTRTNGTNTGTTVWADDAAAAVKITTSRHDTHDQDIATAIDACLTQNNESKPTADFAPNVTATYDLGTTSLKWQDCHINGIGYFHGTDDVDLAGASGAIIVGGDGTGQHVAIDSNEIMSKTDATTAGDLELQRDGGSLSIGAVTGLTSITIAATSATLNGKDILNNNGNVYHGVVPAAGTSGTCAGGSGFTWANTGAGRGVTHNLGTTNYSVIVTATNGSSVGAAVTKGSNTFQETGIGSDGAFDFILIIH